MLGDILKSSFAVANSKGGGSFYGVKRLFQVLLSTVKAFIGYLFTAASPVLYLLRYEKLIASYEINNIMNFDFKYIHQGQI